MPGLKHIWKENSQKSRSFKLQKLEISECDGLETFVSSSVSFQNLTKLKVSKCQGLISLLTSSTAKSLLRLKKMKIFECEGMTDIVSNEGSEAGDEITFSQLKSLVLRCLRSLTSFNSGNCKIIFPSLEKLTVIECPQLKNFSNGVISTPMLKGVKLAAKWRSHLMCNLLSQTQQWDGFGGTILIHSSMYDPTLYCIFIILKALLLE